MVWTEIVNFYWFSKVVEKKVDLGFLRLIQKVLHYNKKYTYS